MRYVQGSETVQEIKSQAIPPGQQVAKAPIRVAGRPVHAVPEGTTTSLCRLEGLHVFADPWERGFGGSGQWCPECVKLAPRGGY